MNWVVFAALPLLVLFVATVNALTWRRGNVSVATRRRVSVLIPARNEEKTIQRALASVLAADASEFVEEILVYDDKSTDGTRRLVQEMSHRDPRIRLLSGGALPPGWVGKPHASSQLADAARGDLLLFMDADVELKAEGLTRLISLTRASIGGQVITAMPQQVSSTFFERLILPLLPLTYLSWLPLRLVEVGNDPRTVAANGQLLMLSKSDYMDLGGFETVKAEIVDDVAFCKQAKRSNKRVVFADGTLMARCRMYEGARETIAGFSKNIYEGVGGSFGLVGVMTLYFSAFLLPYLGLGLGLLGGPAFEPVLVPSAVGVAANAVVQLLLVTRYAQPPSFLLFQPLAILGFMFIALNSWRWQKAGRVTWAGRAYDARSARRPAKTSTQEPPPRTLERSVS